MNHITLIGRIVNELELTATQSGNTFCKFRLAVNRHADKNGEVKADFINCTVWNKQAENLVTYQKKGSLIGLEGRIQTDSYDANDGSKKYITYVQVSRIEFLESKKNAQNSENVAQNSENEPSEDPFADFGANVTIDDNFLE